MLFYISLILLVVFSMLIYPNNIKLGMFWMLILCFLLMFRGENVGTDTSSYMTLYEVEENIITDKEFVIDRTMEISIGTVINFLLSNNLSSRYYIFFMAIVTFMFLHFSLKRMDTSYNIGVLIFFLLFYFDSFNISRQICASSIVLFAFTFLFEKGKRSLLFLLFVLIATTFHATSIVYAVLYLIRYSKDFFFNRVVAIVSIILLCLIFIIFPFNFFSFISNVEYFSYMSIYEEILGVQQINFNGIILFLFRISAFVVLFINYSNGTKLSKENFMLFCVIIALILSISVHSDIARIFIPLEFYMIIYMCNLYRNKRINLKGLPFIYFVFVNMIYRVYTIWIGTGEIVPYTIDFSF